MIDSVILTQRQFYFFSCVHLFQEAHGVYTALSEFQYEILRLTRRRNGLSNTKRRTALMTDVDVVGNNIAASQERRTGPLWQMKTSIQILHQEKY